MTHKKQEEKADIILTHSAMNMEICAGDIGVNALAADGL